jgi:hypothetical protein
MRRAIGGSQGCAIQDSFRGIVALLGFTSSYSFPLNRGMTCNTGAGIRKAFRRGLMAEQNMSSLNPFKPVIFSL